MRNMPVFPVLKGMPCFHPGKEACIKGYASVIIFGPQKKKHLTAGRKRNLANIFVKATDVSDHTKSRKNAQHLLTASSLCGRMHVHLQYL